MTHRLKILVAVVLCLCTACLFGCGSSKEVKKCYSIHTRGGYGCDVSLQCEGEPRKPTSYGQPCPPADDPTCVEKNAFGHCIEWKRPLFVEEAPTQPQTPQGTPLAAIDLQTIAIQPGDFPDGYSAGEHNDLFPAVRPFDPPAENKFYQQIEYDGEAGGGNVSIALFESTQTTSEIYQLVYKDWILPGQVQITGVGVEFEGGKAAGIGDGGAIYNVARVAGKEDNVVLAFQRCHAVVHILLTNPSRVSGAPSSDYPVTDVAVEYAQRLDERLLAVVCDKNTKTTGINEKLPFGNVGAVILAALCCVGIMLLLLVVLIVVIRRKQGQPRT